MDEEHYHLNDLYEDMDRLNALYEELMWPHDAPLDSLQIMKIIVLLSQ